MTYPIPVDPTYDTLLMFESTIEAVYQEELGRPVDPSGRAAMLQMALQGQTVDDLRTWIRASPEWHARHDPRPNDPRHLHGALFAVEQGERIWAPAFGTRDAATQARWIAAYRQRRYDAWPYQVSGRPYRDDWGTLDVDPGRVVRDLTALRVAGFSTILIFDDTRWPDLGYLAPIAAATQPLVDWVMGIMEIRDVLGANAVRDVPGTLVDLLVQQRRLWPAARLAVHFGQSGESYGVGGAAFWHACVDRADLNSYFLEWANGEWDTPDTAVSRMGDFVTRLVGGDGGYPILSDGVCLAEASTLMTYTGAWDEARAVGVNDGVLATFDGRVQDGNPHARLPLMGCLDGLTMPPL